MHLHAKPILILEKLLLNIDNALLFLKKKQKICPQKKITVLKQNYKSPNNQNDINNIIAEINLSILLRFI